MTYSYIVHKKSRTGHSMPDDPYDFDLWLTLRSMGQAGGKLDTLLKDYFHDDRIAMTLALEKLLVTGWISIR